jgi:hypothetical protein
LKLFAASIVTSAVVWQHQAIRIKNNGIDIRSSDSSMKTSDAMGKQMTITGCIAEKNGKYMLKNKKHPEGVELMSSDDLKPHVGHKVSVTGMMQGDSAMSGDKMSNDSMAMSGFKVTSMKMVSEQCTMPDAMMKK